MTEMPFYQHVNSFETPPSQRCSTLPCIRLPWMRRPLQGVADGFPSQLELLAAVGRPPLIAWLLCPAGGSLVGVGWLSPAGCARGKAGWAAGRPRPVRV